ncbi:MAG: cytochrome c family protein, partial [Pseudomonadota bacterium]|nr:cytochrome c family protein [Pseudomonadota bacterium]
MDELGLNKLFAGVLVAGLMLMTGVKLAEVLVPHSELEQNAYVIEVPEGDAVAAAAPADKGPEPIMALLASADAAAGMKLAKKCTAC